MNRQYLSSLASKFKAWRTAAPAYPHPDFTPFSTSAFVLLGAIFGYTLALMHPGLLSDELSHGLQAWDFFNGNFVFHPDVMMFPGYHAVLAAVAKITGHYSDLLHRFTTMFFGLLTPIVAWRIVTRHSPANTGLRSLTTYFFPLLFPYFFLIYTDSWAAMCILGLSLTAVNRMAITTAILGAVAVALRQDMIIWVGFAWLLLALDGLTLREVRETFSEAIIGVARRTWPIIVVMSIVVFLLFVNKGVETGDSDGYRRGVLFNLTNGFIFLLVSWALFLPQNLRALPRIFKALRQPSLLTAVIAGFFIYLFFYSNAHPLNQEYLRHFLHNELLLRLSGNAALRLLAFIPIAWMALTFAVTEFSDKRFYLIFPIGFIAAVAHPLIEPRYYLPALLLFQVFRPDMGRMWERIYLIFCLLATGYLMLGTFSGWFFI